MVVQLALLIASAIVAVLTAVVMDWLAAREAIAVREREAFYGSAFQEPLRTGTLRLEWGQGRAEAPPR